MKRFLLCLVLCCLSLSGALANTVLGVGINVIPPPPPGPAPGCLANQECIYNATQNTNYTGQGALRAAAGAYHPGDTLYLNPASSGNPPIIYNNPPGSGPNTPQDTFFDFDVTIACYGNTGLLVLIQESPCVIDPAAAYNGTAGTGLVSKGMIVVGQVGLPPPNVTISGIEIRNVTSGQGNGVFNCNGVVVGSGAPQGCADSNAGAIRLQSGNLTLNNDQCVHIANCILGESFIWGTGSMTVNNSLCWFGGTGGGQQHCWYLSRVNSVTVNNSYTIDALNGNGIKTRGYLVSVSGNYVGDSSCFKNHNLPLPQWTASTTIAGNNSPSPGMANEVNMPDGSLATLSNNIFCKGSNGSNSAFIDWGAGSVYFWPLPYLNETSDTFYSDFSNSMLIWNAGTFTTIASSGNLVGGNATPKYGVMGLGSGGFAANLISGGAFSPTIVNFTPLLQSYATATPFNPTGPCPQTVNATSSTYRVTLGTSCATTYTQSGSTLSSLVGGSGGSNAKWGAQASFIDGQGYAPSTVNVGSTCGCFLLTDGDTINLNTYDGAGGYIGLVGRNLQVNLSTNTGGVNVPIIESKASFGYPPSGTITGQGYTGPRQPVFIDDGGNFLVNGTFNLDLHASCAPNSPSCPGGAATVQFNGNEGNANGSTPWFFTITGNGFEFASSTPTDWTDPTTHNLIFLNSANTPFSGFGLTNTTVDAGAASGTSWGDTSALDAGYNTRAFVVGSGTISQALDGGSNFTPSANTVPAGIYEVIPVSDSGINSPVGPVTTITPAHVSGGTMTITGVNAGIAQNLYFVALGGETLGCSGTTNSATITATDGSKFSVSGIGCGSLHYNVSPPSGPNGSPNDISLTGSPVTGVANATVPAPVSLGDPWADATSGEGYISVTASTAQTVLNGVTKAAGVANRMAGRRSDLAAALSALQLILGSTSGTLTVNYWSQGAQAATATISINVGSISGNAGVCYNGQVQSAGWTGHIATVGVLSVDTAPLGALAVGQWVWFQNSGNPSAALTGVITAAQITSLGTGTGGVGTYNINDPGNNIIASQQMETAGVTVPTPSGSTLDLRTYGVANCYIIANNLDIIQAAPDSNIVVVGNNNKIEANGLVGSFGGSAAHRGAAVIGNSNTGYWSSAAGTQPYIDGTGNINFGSGGIAAESQLGNTWLMTATAGVGNQGIGGLGVWRIYPGEQNAAPLTSSPNDTWNYILALQQAGCTSATNNPACASGTGMVSPYGVSYDAYSQIDNPGVPGVHTYCVKGVSCNTSNPFASWVDCSTTSNTLASYLASPNVITGGTTPTTNTPPANSPFPAFPSGIPGWLGPANFIHNGPFFVSDALSQSIASVNYYNAAGAGMYYLTDPWSYENGNASVTIRISVVNGLIPGEAAAYLCPGYATGKCYQYTNGFPAVHEWLASMGYRTGGGSFTSDTFTITMTNTSATPGNTYTYAFPITIQRGALCGS